MKLSFYLITFFSFLKIVNSSTQKISEINYASFRKYIKDNKKLLIIFYLKNNIFCEQALKTIENEIINDYNDESGIKFGKINVDSENMLSHKSARTAYRMVLISCCAFVTLLLRFCCLTDSTIKLIICVKII